MIDTHCHLGRCDDPLGAIDPTLKALVTVGTDLSRSHVAVQLANEHPNVYAAVGVHPNDASLARDPDVRAGTEELAAGSRVVAIGETGFDQYWERETLAAQQVAFEWQADLAARTSKALILHVRDKQGEDVAAKAAAAAISAAGHPKGVLHCFSGNEALLEAGLELGWKVSFAGNLTYKSAGRLRELAAEVPLDRLLVETDAPYLAPVPKRGKPNIPAWVRYTASALAEVRGMSLEELEPVLDANASALFGFPRVTAREVPADG